jgi:hypothetical protein
MDNFVLVLGMYYSFLSIEAYLERKFNINSKNNALMVACICAGLGNTFSDATGFAITFNFEMMFYTVIGCLLGMLIIPIMEKLRK